MSSNLTCRHYYIRVRLGIEHSPALVAVNEMADASGPSTSLSPEISMLEVSVY
jgi:hypothetical protein